MLSLDDQSWITAIVMIHEIEVRSRIPLSRLSRIDDNAWGRVAEIVSHQFLFVVNRVAVVKAWTELWFRRNPARDMLQSLVLFLVLLHSDII